MQRMGSLAVGLVFAVVSAACEGGAANPLSPSAVIGSDAATQARSGGGGGSSKPPKGGGGTTGSGTLAWVFAEGGDVAGNGVVNRGDSVTFNITTSVAEPYVELTCRQNGTVVFNKVAGYFPSYPWPWSQVMLLSSDFWVGGTVSCSANLYYFNGLTRTSLNTITFPAYE